MSIDTVKLIEKLSNANGVSGFEDEVTGIVRDSVKGVAEVTEDSLRNLYLHMKSNADQDNPLVMIDGHSDEVGFMVQSITEKGMLKFIAIGGWSAQTVPAHRVRVRNSEGHYLTGVIASKPVHFMTDEEKNKPVTLSNMIIDMGAVSRDEVIHEMKIEPGAPVVPHAIFEYSENTDIMLGKAFDNRLGCAAVVETLQSLTTNNLNVGVVGTISSQEEVGLRGARVSAETVRPDVAIVFEGTPADDTHADKYSSQSALKKGPQIRHRDSSMITNPRFVAFARKVAGENNIPFQDAVRQAGGTDGGSIHLTKHGIPTIVIGIPVRYIHTHYGLTALPDFKHAVEWCVKIVEKLNKEIIGSF